MPLAPSFDTVGLLASEMRDITYVIETLNAARGPKTMPKRVGIARLEDNLLISDTQRLAIENAIKAAIDLGIDDKEVDWPHGPEIREVFRILQGIEALQTHREVLGSWPRLQELYGDDVRSRLKAATAITSADVEWARAMRQRLTQRWDAALQRVDAMLLPSMSCEPSLVSNPDEVEINGITVPFRDAIMAWQPAANLLGIPACVIPAGNELYQSIQIFGCPGEDATVLALAEALQPLLDQRQQRMPTFSVSY